MTRKPGLGVWSEMSLVALWLLLVFLQGNSPSEVKRDSPLARPIIGLLADGLPHAPYSRSPQKRAASRVSIISRGDLKASARAYAVSGDIDRAIKLLKAAAEQVPADLALWSDLAALYIERGDRSGRGYDYLLALKWADDAWNSNSRFPEAAFNRALALERLHLTTDAERAWGFFLTLDISSDWAQEATHHFFTLRRSDGGDTWPTVRPLILRAALAGDYDTLAEYVSRFEQLIREYVAEELLPEWAAATSAGNEDNSRSILAAARVMSHTLREQTGDNLLSVSLDAIVEGDIEVQKNTALGYILFKKGLAEFGERRADLASTAFREAADVLERSGNPFYLWARFYEAICQYYALDYAGALRLLEGVWDRLSGKGYKNLEGRALWVMGLIYYERGYLEEALSFYRSSLARFESTGKDENEAAVLNLIAVCISYLGEREEAWSYRLKALSALPRVISAQRLHNILGQAAEAAAQEGYPRVALYFQNELVRRFKGVEDPVLFAIAGWQRGKLLADLGFLNAAQKEIGKAYQEVEKISDEAQREAIAADIMLAESDVLAERSPAEAANIITKSIDFYRLSDYRYRVAQAYHRRARCRMMSADPEGAVEDFEKAIEEVERQRSSILNIAQRTVYLKAREQIFDDAISYHLDLGDSAAAFDIVERERARALSEVAFNDGLPEVPRQSLVHAIEFLPPGVQIIEYAVVKGRLAIWLISRSGLKGVIVEVDTPRLEAAVRSFVSKLRRGEEAASRNGLAGALFNYLVGPVLPKIENGASLVFVADKFLRALPFSALRDVGAKRYLIESFSITYAPSFAFYMHALGQGDVVEAGEAKEMSALLVADPAFDRKLYPALRPLAQARSEVVAVAGLYRNSKVLRGHEASSMVVINLLPGHQIFMFAGHAVQDGVNPLNVCLLFTADPRGGRFCSADVLSLPLKKMELVILSACATASEDNHNREGAAGLAQSFLGAGVGTVVASMWDIRDRSTKELIYRFNWHFIHGLRPAEALRAAQLELIESAEVDLGDWAAFGIFGL